MSVDMGPCSTCQHFRRVKQPSHLLAMAVATTDDKVTEQLGTVEKDEESQRTNEAKELHRLVSAEDEIWAMRPVMTEYCGLTEEDGVYRVAQVKNRGQRCGDHNEEQPPRRACGTCVHRSPASGPADDQAREEAYTRMATEAITVGQSPEQMHNLLEKYRDNVAARKALEIAEVYAGKGVVPSAPAYLDLCEHFSDRQAGKHVVCVLANRHDLCQAWTAAGQAAATGTPTPAGLGAAPATGTRTSAAASAPPAASPATASNVPQVAPTGLALPDVDAICGYFEWVLDVRLPAEVRDLVALRIAAAMASGDAGAAQEVRQWGDAFGAVQPLDAAQSVYMREQCQPLAVAQLRQSRDDLSRRLIELYDAANASLVLGAPPLTQEMADSVLDAILLCSGYEGDVPPAMRVFFAQQLAARWQALPAEVKQLCADMPLPAAALRVALRGITPTQRTAVIEQWQPALALFLQAGLLAPVPAASAPVPPSPQPEVQYPSDWISATGPPPPAAAASIDAAVELMSGGHAELNPYLVEAERLGPAVNPVVLQLEELRASRKAELAELEKTDPLLAMQRRQIYQTQDAATVASIQQTLAKIGDTIGKAGG